MNKFLILFLLSFAFQACGQVTKKALLEKPGVDKRVELLSIVFRLAERPEYSSNEFKLYSDRIERYFEAYKNHELIQFAKKIINEKDISYDGAMWMATHLDDDLNLLTDVNDIWQQDPRWTKENVEKFVPLLQKFNNDTKFNQFFENNADLYAETTKRFDLIFVQVDLDWCFAFFGKEPTGTFIIKIGLNNGTSCYGTNVDYINGNREVYAIMGVGSVYNAGLPEFSKLYDLPVLIHEFSHPFVDHLTKKYSDMFLESGEKMFSVAKDVINIEAYPTWEVVLDEVLVFASTIKYMKDNDFEQWMIDGWIRWLKVEFGFFWIEELVGELESYDNQRINYPTLESYMPKLSMAYKIWAERIVNNPQ
ncbi:MAG: DUF4932 domain-containing protein [Fibromonadaceae bacterium]|jgi:hypothetical protein|nr:DUF4932 domain-containing protein [Fibromonadaceae bacterium]